MGKGRLLNLLRNSICHDWLMKKKNMHQILIFSTLVSQTKDGDLWVETWGRRKAIEVKKRKGCFERERVKVVEPGKGERGDLDWEWVMDGEGIWLISLLLSNSSTRFEFTELTEFDGFQVFNLILHVIYRLTCKIVWFYESTRDF